MENKLIIYVDMDGTIADIRSAVSEYKEKYDSKKTDDISYLYPWSVPGFFASLKPLPGAIEGVKKLAETEDVWFLSRPSFKNTPSYTEKAEWIRQYFGYEMQKKLILAGNKALMMGDILIDDGDNANQEEFKGVWIRYDWDPFTDWNSVLNEVYKIKDQRRREVAELYDDILGKNRKKSV